MSTNIFVTRPQLPPISELLPYLEKIWASRVLTNKGEFHDLLEAELENFLGVGHVSLVSNGTIGLLIALQALNITGEVITTPFTFVATANALTWNGLRPVFVDIDRDSLNLDPSKIERAITPETSAILAVHCYGNPSATDRLQAIAEKYDLKIIYDACHAFGVTDAGGSILRHGDLSVLSFHATKVFNTFEGGAIISNSSAMKDRLHHLRNFGFVDEVTVVEAGINGKMSEFNAALGLLQLQHFPGVIEARGRIDQRYRDALAGVRGVKCLSQRLADKKNYSYFAILVTDEFQGSRDQLYDEMRRNGVYTRRYFYPLVSEFPMYRKLPSSSPPNLPVAHSVAKQILCLPIYPDLSEADLDRVVGIIRGH